MKKELLSNWISALRSRKYKQGDGSLRKKEDGVDRFCCLGVLCDIVDPEGWREDEGDFVNIYEYKTCEGDELLPDNLRKEIGLSEEDQETLVIMNDEGGKFYQIARWLERKFKNELYGKG